MKLKEMEIKLNDNKKIDNRIYNPTLQIRISPELNDRLDRVADMYGVTRGEIARIAIAQYCGQITGAMDQMAKNQTVDYEKLVDAMIPKLIEAERERVVSERQGNSMDQ